ncbi:hypothetical protein ACRAR1_13510 [Streptomyces sanyensis]|uniref:hypothetical protein n=1 Tax=Streptomyces sanyensis TaxID=568869 RepID=UPI003D77430E
MAAMDSRWELLIYALVTAIAAGVGALVGGGLTLKTQKELAEQDRKAQAAFAAEQRELDRLEQRVGFSRNAAVDLLERVTELWAVVPRLSMLQARGSMAEETVTPLGARRQRVREALDTYRHGMRTALLRVSDEELASRYRTLASLASELASSIEPDSVTMNRAVGDVENYTKFVLISLHRYIDGKSLPQHADPPYLERVTGDASNWHPNDLPEEWDQI